MKMLNKRFFVESSYCYDTHSDQIFGQKASKLITYLNKYGSDTVLIKHPTRTFYFFNVAPSV